MIALAFLKPFSSSNSLVFVECDVDGLADVSFLLVTAFLCVGLWLTKAFIYHASVQSAEPSVITVGPWQPTPG